MTDTDRAPLEVARQDLSSCPLRPLVSESGFDAPYYSAVPDSIDLPSPKPFGAFSLPPTMPFGGYCPGQIDAQLVFSYLGSTVSSCSYRKGSRGTSYQFVACTSADPSPLVDKITLYPGLHFSFSCGHTHATANIVEEATESSCVEGWCSEAGIVCIEDSCDGGDACSP